MTRTSLIALMAAAGLAAAPAIAQADCHTLADGTIAAEHGPPPGDDAELAEAEAEAEDDAELEEEIDAPEDSAILPSAEGHEESEAPTMEIDCEADPALCAGEPLQQASEGPTLSEGADPGEGAPNVEGEAVVAEPQC